MKRTDCPFKECRLTKEGNCKGGFYLYRCTNLNCKSEDIYKNAIEVVTNGNHFSKLEKCGTRTNWKFYKNRISEVKKAKRENDNHACGGCRDKKTEAFECRCAYLCGHKDCEHGTKWGGTNYEILYYQLPVSDKYDGKVDLVIRKVNTKEIYLTEYKPSRLASSESLLRMICEIVSYRQTADKGCLEFFNGIYEDNNLGITVDNIHTAIMFNATTADGVKSPQKDEYGKKDEGIRSLLKKYHITVFELTADKDIVCLDEF